MKGVNLLSITLTALLFGSCGGHGRSMPSLSLSPQSPQDSLAYLMLVGDSVSEADSLRLGASDAQAFAPDTLRYREVYVAYPASGGIAYYQLVGGEWRASAPPSSALRADTVRSFPPFGFTDVSRKYQSSYELSRRRLVIMSFSDHTGRVLSKVERERLKQRYTADSLRWVYFYLTLSDSTARSWARRDSLKGIFFSDSTGEVTRLRAALGIGRSAQPEVFVIDSTQQILKHL